MSAELKAQDVVSGVSLAPITLEVLKRYAMASGDFNPIHQDEAVARSMGLPGVIAHGMLTCGYLGERARRFLDERGVLSDWTWSSMTTKFKAMTLLGDIITVSGVVREVSAERLVLDLSATKQTGELTTSAVIKFIRKG